MSRIVAFLGTLACWLAAVALLAGGVAAVSKAHQSMLRNSGAAAALAIIASKPG